MTASARHKPAGPIEPFAVRLDRHLRDVAPESYAGTVEARGDRLVVRLVPPASGTTAYSALLRRVEAFVESFGTPVEIKTAVWSLRELESASDRVSTAVAGHANLELSRWGVDIEANRVRFGYLGDPATMATLLEQLGYDDDIVLAEQDTELSQSF